MEYIVNPEQKGRGRGGLQETQSNKELDAFYRRSPNYSSNKNTQDSSQEEFSGDISRLAKTHEPIESIQRNLSKVTTDLDSISRKLQNIEKISAQIAEIHEAIEMNHSPEPSDEDPLADIRTVFEYQLTEITECHEGIKSLYNGITEQIESFHNTVRDQTAVYDMIPTLLQDLRENTNEGKVTQGELGKVTDKIKKLENSVSDSTKKISTSSDGITHSCTSIQTTVHALEQTGGDIQAIYNKLLPLFASFETAQKVLSEYQSKVTDFLTEILNTHRNLDSRCGDLFARVEKEATQIKNLLDSVNTCRDEISCSYSAIGSTLENIRNCEDQLEKLVKILNSIQASIDSSLGKINSSIASYNTLKRAVDSMVSDVRGIKDKLSANSSLSNSNSILLSEFKKMYEKDMAELKKRQKTNQGIIVALVVVIALLVCICIVLLNVSPFIG